MFFFLFSFEGEKWKGKCALANSMKNTIVNF